MLANFNAIRYNFPSVVWWYGKLLQFSLISPSYQSHISNSKRGLSFPTKQNKSVFYLKRINLAPSNFAPAAAANGKYVRVSRIARNILAPLAKIALVVKILGAFGMRNTIKYDIDAWHLYVHGILIGAMAVEKQSRARLLYEMSRR